MRKTTRPQVTAQLAKRDQIKDLLQQDKKTILWNLLQEAEFVTKSIWTERIFAFLAKEIIAKNILEKQYMFSLNDITKENTEIDHAKVVNEISEELFAFSLVDEENGKKLLSGSVALFVSTYWNNNTHRIAISFNPDIDRLIIQLCSKYQLLNLEEFVRLTTVYSQRLYRKLMIVAIENKYPIIRLTTKELYAVMSPPPGARQKFTVFEADVLKPTVYEINQKTNMKIKYDKIKSGRCIDSIIFMLGNTIVINNK